VQIAGSLGSYDIEVATNARKLFEGVGGGAGSKRNEPYSSRGPPVSSDRWAHPSPSRPQWGAPGRGRRPRPLAGARQGAAPRSHKTCSRPKKYFPNSSAPYAPPTSISRRRTAKTRIASDCVYRRDRNPRHTVPDPLVLERLAIPGEGAPIRERRIFICLSPQPPRQQRRQKPWRSCRASSWACRSSSPAGSSRW